MAVDEAARLRLYEKARDTWGDEEAATLMSSLPRDLPQLATKDDLAVLRAELVGAIDSRVGDAIRILLFAMIASNATLVGLVLAAVKLG